MKNGGTSGKTHGSKAVILCDYKIPGFNTVDQTIVYTVRTFVEDQCLSTASVKFMRCIAKQEAGELIFTAYLDGNVYNRTSVGIY